MQNYRPHGARTSLEGLNLPQEIIGMIPLKTVLNHCPFTDNLFPVIASIDDISL